MHAPRHVHTLRSLANYWLAGWLAHLAHLQFLFAFTSNSGLPLLISKASRASRARFCEEGASHGCRLPSCFGCIPSWLPPVLVASHLGILPSGPPPVQLPQAGRAGRTRMTGGRTGGCLPWTLPPIWSPVSAASRPVLAASHPSCLPSCFGCIPSWLPPVLFWLHPVLASPPPVLAASRPGCLPSWLRPVLASSRLGRLLSSCPAGRTRRSDQGDRWSDRGVGPAGPGDRTGRTGGSDQSHRGVGPGGH